MSGSGSTFTKRYGALLVALTIDEDGMATTAERKVQVAQRLVELVEREGLRREDLLIDPLVFTLASGDQSTADAAVETIAALQGIHKEIPGVRTYVSVDGGMADNIRPALYGARYTALVANKADKPAEETVTIAGKFCESGDVLLRDAALPRLEGGDILAVPMVGAYCLAMASNYNLALRPAAVLVRDGRAGLIRAALPFWQGALY